MAEALDAMCQLCHVKLRPQMYVDLKRNDQHRAVPVVQPDPLLRAAGPRGPSSAVTEGAATLHIHIDGASRGQPRRGRLRRPRHRRDRATSAPGLYGYLGRATNNVAEYQALIHALR